MRSSINDVTVLGSMYLNTMIPRYVKNCDDGEAQERVIFSNRLKLGDVILTHDPYCEFRLTSSLTMTKMEVARLIPGLHLAAEVSDP